MYIDYSKYSDIDLLKLYCDKLGISIYDLKKIGVVLKRALYFITCSGKMMYPTKLEENYICQNLMSDKTQIPKEIRESGYQQISLFDTGLEENLCISSSAKTTLMGF